MKNYFQRTHFLLLLVLLLAGFLRFYQLGTNPPSLDWDEASLGYNAYSILKTGRDEFGNFLPLSIRSFEDYKPAVYTYLTVPSVALFGLTEFAVRLPSAILGTLTILIVYLVLSELVKLHPNFFLSQKYKNRLPLLVAFIVAVSPWHLQFSRVAFESNIAVFFVLGGIYFFLKGRTDVKWWFHTALFFVFSFYSYHSPRLVVPLLLFGWAIYYRKYLWEKRGYVILSVIFGLILLIPFIKEFTYQGKARFSSVTVVTPQGTLDESIKRIEFDQSRGDIVGKFFHNRRIVYGQKIAQGYLDHFNIDFLFLKGDAPDRHHARDMGMLYIWEFPFILIGLGYFVSKRAYPLLWWYLVAPAASALTTGTPHAVRALLLIPTYQIFTGVGILWVIEKIKNKKRINLVFLSTGLVIFLTTFFYYLQMYYVHTPIEASQDWQYGYKEAIAEIDNYPDVDKIIMTYKYDQPHVFVLFYNKVDPAWYQAQWKGGEIQRSLRSFGKYEFRSIDWVKDANLTNTLFVGAPDEIPDDALGLVREISFLNGKIAFRIVKR